MENKLKEDLKQAQLNRDETKVSTLRLLLAEIHNVQITLRQNSPREDSGQAGQEKELSDQETITVIQRGAKKRKEAIEGFRKGGNQERAQKEELELKILESYLPAQLSNEVLTKIVEDAINNVGAKNLSEMGKVMAEVMSKVGGHSDGGRVSALVKEKLS